jgi:hypothetical protein
MYFILFYQYISFNSIITFSIKQRDFHKVIDRKILCFMIMPSSYVTKTGQVA